MVIFHTQSNSNIDMAHGHIILATEINKRHEYIQFFSYYIHMETNYNLTHRNTEGQYA